MCDVGKGRVGERGLCLGLTMRTCCCEMPPFSLSHPSSLLLSLSLPLLPHHQLSEPEKQKDRDIIVVAIDSYDKTAANTPAGIAGIADSASEIAELTGSSKSMSPLAAMKEARKEARKRVVSTPLSPRSRKPSSFAEVRHSLPQRKMKRGSVASRAQASAQALWSNAVVASLNAISNAVSTIL